MGSGGRESAARTDVRRGRGPDQGWLQPTRTPDHGRWPAKDYWNAPGHFGPWAGGYFKGFGGGSLLPTLLVGSALGAGLGLGAGMLRDLFDDGDGGGWDDGGGGGDGGDFDGGDDNLGGDDLGF